MDLRKVYLFGGLSPGICQSGDLPWRSAKKSGDLFQGFDNLEILSRDMSQSGDLVQRYVNPGICMEICGQKNRSLDKSQDNW